MLESPTAGSGILRRLLQRLAPLIGLLIVGAVFASLEPAFLSGRNLITIPVQTVVVALGAIGATFVIASGGIDLSVGSSIALASMMGAATLRAGHSPWVAALTAIAVGTALGVLNGALVVGLRIVPFIATLGTMGIARGLTKWIGSERSIEPGEAVKPLQDLLVKSWSAPGLLITGALTILFAVILARSVFGVHTLAIGSSEPTARLCGIPVGRRKIQIYALAGALGGLAGVFQLGRVGVGDPTAAIGLELDVIAAVVIGGASLSGGSGSIIGSLIGALLMVSLATGCTLVGVPTYVQEMVVGTIIIVAVSLDRWRH
ncbi:MAG: ribose transport system permease protein [Planctomycetota bacterium]|jgi:ribose transport system permease protein